MAVSATGRDHCAVLDDGNVFCWGSHGSLDWTPTSTHLHPRNLPQLGMKGPDAPHVQSPARRAQFPGNRRAVGVAAAYLQERIGLSYNTPHPGYACAILDDGGVACWGNWRHHGTSQQGTYLQHATGMHDGHPDISTYSWCSDWRNDYGGGHCRRQETDAPWAVDTSLIFDTSADSGSGIVNVTGATCSASPALPAGLSIDSSTCTISGTPAAPTRSGAYTVTANIGSEAYQYTVGLSGALCTSFVATACVTAEGPSGPVDFAITDYADAAGNVGGACRPRSPCDSSEPIRIDVDGPFPQGASIALNGAASLPRAPHVEAGRSPQGSGASRTGDVISLTFRFDEVLTATPNVTVCDASQLPRREVPDGWSLLFRQTAGNYPALPTDWLRVEPSSNASDFSRLDELESWRSPSDGKFRLKLVWPQRASGPTSQEWKQTTNPVTAASQSGVVGYEPVDVHYSPDRCQADGCRHWGGLERSSTNQNLALLDGSVSHSFWWFAVGTTQAFRGGIPGGDQVESQVELYAYVDPSESAAQCPRVGPQQEAYPLACSDTRAVRQVAQGFDLEFCYVEQPMDYQSAIRTCEAMGLQLVQVTTAEKYAAIDSFIAGGTNNGGLDATWLALTCSAEAATCDTSFSGWQWAAGTSLEDGHNAFEFSADGTIAGGSPHEYCGHWWQNGRWAPQRCSDSTHYGALCEPVPPGPPSRHATVVCEAETDDSTTCTASYEVLENDRSAPLAFSISGHADRLGNEGQTVTLETCPDGTSAVVDNTKPTVLQASLRCLTCSSTLGGLAAIGDTLELELTMSEYVVMEAADSMFIMGEPVVAQCRTDVQTSLAGEELLSWVCSGTYTITAGHALETTEALVDANGTAYSIAVGDSWRPVLTPAFHVTNYRDDLGNQGNSYARKHIGWSALGTYHDPESPNPWDGLVKLPVQLSDCSSGEDFSSTWGCCSENDPAACFAYSPEDDTATLPIVESTIGGQWTGPSVLAVDPMAPSLAPVTISCDDDPATAGSIITVTFTASEPLAPETVVSIAGVVATDVSCDSSNLCTATHTVVDDDAQGEVAISIDFADVAGNSGSTAIASTDASTVSIDTVAPAITSVSLASNGADSTMAVVGSVVTLTFTVSEAIQTPNVTMAGRAASVSCVEGVCRATITLGSDDTPGNIDWAITTIADLAGNDGAGRTNTADGTTDGTEVAFDDSVLMLTAVSLASNSATNTLYAKADDVITLSITASMPINVPTVVFIDAAGAMVDDARVSPTGSAGETSFTASFTVGGGDAEGLLGFHVDYTDFVGSTPGSTVTGTTDATSATIDMTAPVLSLVTITTSQSPAAVGEVITVTFVPSEPLADGTTASIAGSNATNVTCVADGACTATHTVVSADTEGVVAVLIDFTDQAGNAGTTVTETTDGTTATIDMTAPSLAPVTVTTSHNSPATVGSVITVMFTPSEPLADDATVSIAGVAATDVACVVHGACTACVEHGACTATSEFAHVNNKLAAGGTMTSAVLDDGSVMMSGLIADRSNVYFSPVDLGEGRTAVSISSGGSFSCAVLDDSSVKCWGKGQWYELGNGHWSDTRITGFELRFHHSYAENSVDLGTGRSAVAVDCGLNHACAILDDGSLKCWGNRRHGQTGNGPLIDQGQSPLLVDLGTDRTAVAVASGWYHTCATLDDGSLKCWGSNQYGQLGIGETCYHCRSNTDVHLTPGLVDLGTGRTAIAISAGDRHTCAILDNGSLKCWGLNSHGQVGIGGPIFAHDTPGEVPPELVNLGYQPVHFGLSGGWTHTSDCRSSFCFASPMPVHFGTARNAVAVSAGGHYTCAILDNGALKCWGRDVYGLLGDGEPVTPHAYGQRGYSERASSLLQHPGDHALPVSVDLGTGRTAVAISAGGEHACAILDDSSMKCWGRNRLGEMGIGVLREGPAWGDYPSPVLVSGNFTWDTTSLDCDDSDGTPDSRVTVCSATHAVVADDTQGPVAISIDFDDVAGNMGVTVTGPTDSSNTTIDTVAPALAPVTISCDDDPATAGSIITVTFTASEPLAPETVVSIAGVVATDV
eukprot:COSAG02_NODE_1778_length_10950_cov_7.595060_1_plen_2048_part_10